MRVHTVPHTAPAITPNVDALCDSTGGGGVVVLVVAAAIHARTPTR